MAKLTSSVKTFWRDFLRDQKGMIAPVAALALIPLMTAAGAVVDYSRASNIRTKLQSALDAALLAGAKDTSSNWNQIAIDNFDANINAIAAAGLSISRNFAKEPNQIFRGSATASMPTAFLGLIHIPNLSVAVAASATASEPDNSCILTLDRGQPPSSVSLSLNGAPIVNLSGCSIRSNTSIDCNGHDGAVTKAISAGQSAGCGNPTSSATSVPDIYAPLANNIVTQCGTSRTGATWTAGILPMGPGIKTVVNGGRTEYHICGDLTVSGIGLLTGTLPVSDALIVIENGSLYIEKDSVLTIARMAVVFTGNNEFSSTINFPTGAGNLASLTLSPPIDVGNPWQGVSLYLDPKLTKDVNNKWGPGASFSADGLVYLGNSNVVTDGNTSSSNAKCSKFVMNRFTTNGRVNLDFNQSVASCGVIGLKQWGGVIVHLTK
jgi:Flp pilus assembly protein TadG